MLGDAAAHALAPHFEGAALHFAAHQRHHRRFVETKLHFDGFKRRAVFPRHFNDSGNILRRQRRCLGKGQHGAYRSSAGRTEHWQGFLPMGDLGQVAPKIAA